MPRGLARANRRAVGYACSYTFFCEQAAAPRLRAGLASLFIVRAGRSQATLGDDSVVTFDHDWEAAEPPPSTYALVPLTDRNIRDAWLSYFEDGHEQRGSPAFDHAPWWLRSAPVKWFGVLARLDADSGGAYTAFSVRPYFKDMAHILAYDTVLRFYRRMAFENGACLGLFSDDYRDVLFSADVLVARDMQGCSFDESAPDPIDRFVAQALLALSRACDW